MIDLDFRVENAVPAPYAAAPQVNFRLQIVGPADRVVHAVTLRCQVQIEATRRRYTAVEQRRLVDLFGEPDRWSQTLRPMLWTSVGVVVPTFRGETTVDVPVPCSFDFNVAATKYFHALTEGDLPLRFLFSGTVFYEDLSTELRVMPISSEKEASFRWPVDVWRAVIETYYPKTAWICLRRDVFDRMFDFKAREALPTWEDTMERLLGTAEPAEPVAQ
jgi:hypothetical protein